METPGRQAEATPKAEARPPMQTAARRRRRRRRLMPEDPLARGLVWFCIVVSVVLPVVAALVLEFLR